MERQLLQYLMTEFTPERVNVLRKEYHMDDGPEDVCRCVPTQQISNGVTVRSRGEAVATDGVQHLRSLTIPVVDPLLIQDDEQDALPQEQMVQMADLAHRLNDIVDRFSQQGHVAAGNHDSPVLDGLTLQETAFYANIHRLNSVNVHQIAHLLNCGPITRRTLQIALDFIIANTSGSLAIGLALDLYATLLAMRYLTSDHLAWVSRWIVDYVSQRLPNWRRLFSNN